MRNYAIAGKLTRSSLPWIEFVNEGGRVEFYPHYFRAMLAAIIESGATAYRQAGGVKNAGWDGLAAGLATDAIEAAATLLKKLQQRAAEAVRRQSTIAPPAWICAEFVMDLSSRSLSSVPRVRAPQ